MGKIILASSSPRRANILKESGYCYEIIPSPYEEQHTRAVFSYDYIEELAYKKASAVVPLVSEPALIVGADTMVVVDNEILGKPEGFEDACQMLRKLSGRKHKVITAVVVINTENNEIKKQSVTSEVEFYPLSDEQIQKYVNDFEPYDKAGSYGIQEMPEGYIKGYTGSLKNIIGLCPDALAKMLG